MGDLKELFMPMRAMLSKAVAGIVQPHDIEDVIQETYVRLCLVENEDEIKHPRSYLYRMAQNLARDHVKRSEYRLTDSWDEELFMAYSQSGRDSDEVFDQVVSSEKFSAFCDAVRLLPLQCRRVFVLKKVYGYSQREIAKELAISESTVEKHIALAMRRCIQLMDRESRATGFMQKNRVGDTHE